MRRYLFFIIMIFSIFSVQGAVNSFTPAATPANDTWTSNTQLSASFTAVSTTDATFTCGLYVNNVLSTVNSSVANNTASVLFNNTMPEGNNDWYVNCTDSSGTTQSDIFVLHVDQTDPTTTLNDPADSATVNGDTSADVNFTITDALASTLNYTVFLNGKANVTGQVSNGSAQTATITGLSDGVSYTWLVEAVDEAGNAVNSSSRSFTFNDNVPPKTAPTLTQGGVVDSDTDGNVELSWSGSTASYNVYRLSTNITNATALTALGTTSSTSYEDNTTQHGTTYWYAITSVDGAGNENKSLVSDSFSVTPNDATDPKLPASVSATANSDGSVAVTWDAVTEDTSDQAETNIRYYVFRTTNRTNLTPGSVTPTANTTSTSYTDTGITTGVNYSYVVTVVDEAGNHNTAKTAYDTIMPAACTTSFSYGSWTTCSGGTQTRSGTRTCYGGGDTSDSQSQSCSTGSARRSPVANDRAKNPQASWQFQKVTPGAASIMKVYDAELGIRRIEIHVNNQKNNVKITVEKHSDRPANVTHDIQGKVYSYLEINKENLEDDDVENSTVVFAASKSWLNQQGVAKERVVLMRYDNGWQELPTEQVGETETEVEYSATTPGFSYFAVAEGSKQDMQTDVDETDNTETPPADVDDTVDETQDTQEPEDTPQVDNTDQGSSMVWLLVLVVVIGAAAGYYFTQKK